MLANKVSQLQSDVITAKRIADFWQKQIDLYGEVKAEAFYRSLGLNHLESHQAKSIEWEGLTLSRQPTEIEKLCVKGIAQAQEAGKESVKSVLMKARESLIDSGITAIKKLTPATYHELVLSVPDKFNSELRVQVEKVFKKGKVLMASELARGGGKMAYTSGIQVKQTEDDDAELDDLTDLTDSRLANDVQSRITAAVARFTLLGLIGTALWDAVRGEIETGSISYIDRSSTGLANKVLNFGRMREAQDRKDEWDRVEYSAILDQNVCEPCASEDGTTASNEADLQPAPNPECQGGDWCRCFHIYINQ